MALMPVADALAAVLAGAEPLPAEMAALDGAFHRVLAGDVAALRTQPPQAMSAMDGYAVRASDASEAKARLKLIGAVAAGRPFERAVGAGEAVRIFTGGVIPEGADAVVIQEDTVADGAGITIMEPAIAGRHIRPAGVDFNKGDVLLTAGTRLTDRDLSLAAGMNYPELAGAPAANGRGARHRRRTGDAGLRARARGRSSTPTAMRCGRWHGPKAPRPSISASPPTPSRRPRRASAAPATAAPTSSSPPAAPRSATMISSSSRWRQRASPWRSGGSRCGRASR